MTTELLEHIKVEGALSGLRQAWEIRLGRLSELRLGRPPKWFETWEEDEREADLLMVEIRQLKAAHAEIEQQRLRQRAERGLADGTWEKLLNNLRTGRF